MLTLIMAVGIMNKTTINGQPDAQINAPANPQVRELRQGICPRCGSEMHFIDVLIDDLNRIHSYYICPKCREWRSWWGRR
jgi:hypothetical protein